MQLATAAVLHRINLDFYERHAAAFSATRQAAWPGWRRVARRVEKRHRGGGVAQPAVLDLGCGNGRLLRFLDDRWGGRFSYVGLDSSAALLRLAAAAAGRPGRRFLRRDLFVDGLPGEPPGAPFDLIAAFGLMHHLPGAGNRRRLLRQAAALLSADGLLAVSFWQFGDRERFRRRVVDWQVHNRTAAEPVDAADLEPGDRLLAWGEEPPAGGGPPPVRYCSWTPPAAAERLLAGLPLDPVDSFDDDGAAGQLNHYRVLAPL